MKKLYYFCSTYIIQPFVFYSLLFDIKLIYFVTKTRWGYSFYLSCLAVIFGTKVNQPGLLYLFSFLFSCYTLGSCFFLFILVKTPKTRKYLGSLFGEDYLVKHLGAHMMSRAMWKVFGGVAGIMVAEKGAEHFDRMINYKESDELINRQQAHWKSTEYLPSKQDRDALFEKSNEMRYKPVSGLSDQAYTVFKNILAKHTGGSAE